MNKEDIHEFDTFILVGVMVLPEHRNLYDQCISLAVKKGVRKLNITMFEDYDLPQVVFEFKSLVELKLGSGCCLNPEGRVAWPNLKQLILTGMYAVKGNDLGTIIRGCPSIEYLEVSSYSVIGKCFKVASKNLNQLRFHLVDDQRLEVNATPNLESLYCASSASGGCKHMLDFGSTEYPNLKSVEVRDGIIDKLFSTNFASRFPILENLIIKGGELSKMIDISSTSLKKIELKYPHVLEEACFDVPNLVHFKYERTLNTHRDKVRPKLLITGKSDGWSSDIMLHEYGSKIDASWFLKLNEFLNGLNGSETSITINFYDSKLLEASLDEANLIIENSAISIPCVRGFNLRTCKGNISWSSVSAILDGILLVCKPRMISIGSPTEFVKLIYEKLTSKSGHDHYGVTDTEMSYGRDSEQSTLSDRFKDLKTFFKEFAKRKSVGPINFHLEYCSGKCPKCSSTED